MQDRHDLARDFAIEVMTRGNNDQARAESERFAIGIAVRTPFRRAA